MTKQKRYLHFTDYKSAKEIANSQTIWKSSFGPEAVFAGVEGGAFVPGVQMTKMGRAKNRNAIVLFTTNFLPDIAFPEEVGWHLDVLPISVVDIVSAEKAKNYLSNTIPEDDEFGMLKIPLHPAFDIFGDWTRMPEDFKSWIPGTDNEKYKTARDIWIKAKNVNKVKEFWHKNNSNLDKFSEVKKIIEAIVSNILNEH